jgi:hypothetical protein
VLKTTFIQLEKMSKLACKDPTRSQITLVNMRCKQTESIHGGKILECWVTNGYSALKVDITDESLTSEMIPGQTLAFSLGDIKSLKLDFAGKGVLQLESIKTDKGLRIGYLDLYWNEEKYPSEMLEGFLKQKMSVPVEISFNADALADLQLAMKEVKVGSVTIKFDALDVVKPILVDCGYKKAILMPVRAASKVNNEKAMQEWRQSHEKTK